MGSILETTDCPTCGQEAFIEVYLDTGEENIQCHHCGYGRRLQITNLDKQQEPGWQPKVQIHTVNGYGCYKILGKGSKAFECGAFTTPDSIFDFISHVENIKNELDHAEYSVLTKNNKIENHILIQGSESRAWHH